MVRALDLQLTVMSSNPCNVAIFRFFWNGGRHYLGFWKFYIANGQNDQECRTTSLYQILSKSLEPRSRYRSFGIFQNGGYRAKCRKRSNRGRDNVSFNIMLVWLKMSIHAPFGGTFPPNDVTHRPNSKTDRPWAEPRHLSHKARISVARFELGVGTIK